MKISDTDPMNGYKDDLLWYTNIISSTKGDIYRRRRYNLMDALEQAGGMLGCLRVLTQGFVLIFTFQKHKIKIVNYTKKDEFIEPKKTKDCIPIQTQLLAYRALKLCKCNRQNTKLDDLIADINKITSKNCDLKSILKINN